MSGEGEVYAKELVTLTAWSTGVLRRTFVLFQVHLCHPVPGECGDRLITRRIAWGTSGIKAQNGKRSLPVPLYLSRWLSQRKRR